MYLFCYGDFAFALGAVVSKLTTLADASRAKRKSKIAVTKYNKTIQNESKSKNRFPDKNIQRGKFNDFEHSKHKTEN